MYDFMHNKLCSCTYRTTNDLEQDLCIIVLITFCIFLNTLRGCRGRDRMVVGFTTTCAISAYHQW